MLDIEGVDPAELQLDSYHAHVQADGLQFAGLVVEFWLLEEFEDVFEFLVSQFHVFAGLGVFFFGAEAACDVVEEAELEVQVFFGGVLGDGAVGPSVNFIGPVHL